MKTSLKIFTNPIGIAVNLVHCLIVIFAFLTQDNPFVPANKVCFHCDYTLFNWLLYFNLPSFAIIELIAIPIHLLLAENLLIEIFLGIILVFLIFLQWFLVGYVISRVIDIFKSKEIKISLE